MLPYSPRDFALKHLGCILSCILLVLLPGPVLGDNAASCVVAPTPVGSNDTAAGSNDIFVTAKKVTAQGSETTTFEGDVVIHHQGRSLTADQAVFHHTSRRLELNGNIRLSTEAGDYYESAKATINAGDRTGTLSDGSFYFTDNGARGTAGRITLKSDRAVVLESVRFSTCPADRETWRMSFSRLTLDRASDNGIGRNVLLRIHGIPLFYTPYLRFPLGNRRQSGLLIPEFASTDNTGTTFAWPYYFNLAPNYDLTLTPRWLSTRGLELDTEFRYLGRSLDGTFDLSYLDRDRPTGATRYLAEWQHQQRFGERTRFQAHYNVVSDAAYFEDLQSGFSESNITHLPRRVSLDYFGSRWSLGALMADYQILDTTLAATDLPYVREPQLNLHMRPWLAGNSLRLLFDAQAGHYIQPALEDATRINVNPGIQFPLTRPWGFFTPTLNGRYTGYHNRSIGNDVDISTMLFSLDTGLYLDRHKDNSPWTQTLEPRLYYVYSPYVDQSTLPVLDTSEADFSFGSLFRDNRFVGGDRIGDSNRLSLSLSSRWLHDQLGERVRMHIGQIHYFDPQQVSASLPPAPATPAGQSETVAEVVGLLGHRLYLRSTWYGDLNTWQTNRTGNFLQYQPGPDRIFSLGYRYDRLGFETADVSFRWPLGRRWTFFGRSHTALASQTNLDSYIGFQYDACCWRVWAVSGRRVDSTGAQNNLFQIQFQLKGLGGGNNPGAGYDPMRYSVFTGG